VKSPDLFLAQILECLAKIQTYTAEGRAAFLADTKTQEAVLRNFEVIGEATKRLGPEITGAHPELPWRQMAGFRDILIHAYDRVDVEEVWNIVEREVPGLAAQIQTIRDEVARPNRIPPPPA